MNASRLFEGGLCWGRGGCFAIVGGCVVLGRLDFTSEAAVEGRELGGGCDRLEGVR